MLSYKEELNLSDQLVERRQVRDQLHYLQEDPDTEQARVLDNGRYAAQELVTAYMPYIYSMAISIYNRHNNNSNVQVDDLVNEGVIAALKCTWSFNARGSGDHPGVRFANYAGMAIQKAMNRYLAKMSTPLKADVSVIQASWVWVSAKRELREQLGHNPSTEEVENHTNISANYVLTQLPHRESFLNVSESDQQELSGGSQVAQLVEEDNKNSTILRQALGEVIGPLLVNALLLYLGVDRYYPRSIKEVAAQLDMGIKDTKAYLGLAQDAICHPKHRVALYKIIQRLDGNSCEEV